MDTSDLAPFQPELIDEDNAVALCHSKSCAVWAEAEPSHEIILRALVGRFGRELVSLFAVLIVEGDNSVRLGTHNGSKQLMFNGVPFQDDYIPAWYSSFVDAPAGLWPTLGHATYGTSTPFIC